MSKFAIQYLSNLYYTYDDDHIHIIQIRQVFNTIETYIWLVRFVCRLVSYRIQLPPYGTFHVIHFLPTVVFRRVAFFHSFVEMSVRCVAEKVSLQPFMYHIFSWSCILRNKNNVHAIRPYIVQVYINEF